MQTFNVDNSVKHQLYVLIINKALFMFKICYLLFLLVLSL